MAFFYEIRGSNNAVLKRDGGFATQDSAKTARREVAKKMKNMRQPDRADVGRILVGQNADKPARHRSQFFNYHLSPLPKTSALLAFKFVTYFVT
jgi:hypothetical protein